MTTNDPRDPSYLDEKSVRDEFTRSAGVCQTCRRCVDLCSSFPTLFDMIDRHADRDAGRLTPAQQDQVVDECFHCNLCAVGCPYAPDVDDQNVDVPRLMLRVEAMRFRSGQHPIRRRVTTQVLGHADMMGKLATTLAPAAGKLVNARAGSVVRKVVAGITGVSSQRALPPYATQRFSAWFAKRTSNLAERRQGRVTLFPTCLVEYQVPQIGRDLVHVFERNGIACANTAAGCCGAPWLQSGDTENFARVAAGNVRILADEVRRGGDIVVPSPTCRSVLITEYVDRVGGPEAELVAAHTHDACEYLMTMHHGDTTHLDTGFTGEVPDTIRYHVACHRRGRRGEWAGRDLLELTGAEVEIVQQCCGSPGPWGFRAENDAISMPLTTKLSDRITKSGVVAVAGDCIPANTAIADRAGMSPVHPIQLVARAYGIATET